MSNLKNRRQTTLAVTTSSPDDNVSVEKPGKKLRHLRLVSSSEAHSSPGISQTQKGCTKCGQSLPLEAFYSKGGGRKDSACKGCVGKAKAKSYKSKKKKEKMISSIRSVIIGELTDGTIEAFSKTFSTSIEDLKDAGKL